MTTKLEKLTPEQEAIFPIYRDKWLKIGLDTNPTNRDEAEAAIRLTYECGGLLPPKVIIWCRSPLEGALERKNQVKNQVGEQIWEQVKNQVGAQVWNQVSEQVRNQVGYQIWEQIWEQVRNQVDYQIWNQVSVGQHDVYWLSFYDFFINETNIIKDHKLQGIIELAKHCGWYWPFKDVVILTEKPILLKRDDDNRLHCEDGPALLYSDNFSLWKWHGVTVPDYVITHPETITIQQIDNEENAEVRRIMIERYGFEKYMTDSNVIIIETMSNDHPIIGLRTARLLRKDLNGDEPIIMLDMLNSTPESDGSVKRYMIRIDPNAYDGQASQTCIAAMASTYRLSDGSLVFSSPDDYHPEFES